MKENFTIKGSIENSPALKQGALDYDHLWTLSKGGILNIYGNLIQGDFERILKNNIQFRLIQFARRFDVNEKTLKLLNENIFSSNEPIPFRETFNGFGSFNDLQFLKHLSNLKSFGFGACYNIDLSPIADYVKLTNFGLGGHNISLNPIEGYKYFTSFGFGPKIKDFNIISTFYNLENLTIGSQNLKSLDFIKPLKNLKRISFSLGGTVEFNDLISVNNLEDIDIWRTRKLEVDHLKPINEVKKLKILKLRELPRIENFDWLNNSSLNTLLIEELKGVKSFESLRNKNNLKVLVVKDRLDKEKITSLGMLSNFESIQVYETYLEKYKDEFLKLSNRDKIQELEFQYL